MDDNLLSQSQGIDENEEQDGEQQLKEYVLSTVADTDCFDLGSLIL